MRTSGHGHEWFMVLVPIGVAFLIGLAFYGGPTGLMNALDHFVRDVVYFVGSAVSAWL